MSNQEKIRIEKCIKLLKEDGKNTKEIVAEELYRLVDNHNKKWGIK